MPTPQDEYKKLGKAASHCLGELASSAKYVRFVVDAARQAESLPDLPSESHERKELLAGLTVSREILEHLSELSASVTSGANIAATGLAASISGHANAVDLALVWEESDPQLLERIRVVRSTLHDYAAEEFPKMLSLMEQLGLDKAAAGGLSRLDHFRKAHHDFERTLTALPDTGPIGNLRAALNDTLAALLQHCKPQKRVPGPNDKVEHILGCLGLGGMSSKGVEKLMGQAESLQDRLSQALKKGDLTREGTRALLMEGSLFLEELLLQIDISKIP